MGILLSVSTSASAQTESRTVQIGVLSNESAGVSSLPWTSVARHLTEKIPGHAFEVVPLSRDQVTAKIHDKTIDFIIVDPAFLDQLKTRYGVEPIATLQTRFKGANFALSGGTLFYFPGRSSLPPPANAKRSFSFPGEYEFNRPQDLKYRTIAISDNEALLGWLAVLREFHNVGLKNDRHLITQVLRTDREVVEAVLKGEVDAGCVKAGVIESVIAEQKLDNNTLRVLAFTDIDDPNPRVRIPVAVSTRLYPDISFAACPHAAPDLVENVTSNLMTMSQPASEAVDRPQAIGWTSPRSDLAVHECLKELRIPPHENFGEIHFDELFRQHRSWVIGTVTLMVVLLLITIYVVALNPAPWRPILECRRAEAALRASIERFERIASCSADWIWETDAEDCFTYSNSIVEQMLGYRADEIIGKSHFDLFATAEKERLMALGQKGLGTGARIFRERFRLLTKDRRVVIQETTAEPIIDSRGQFAGYRGVSRDITNQVRFVRLRQ